MSRNQRRNGETASDCERSYNNQNIPYPVHPETRHARHAASPCLHLHLLVVVLVGERIELRKVPDRDLVRPDKAGAQRSGLKVSLSVDAADIVDISVRLQADRANEKGVQWVSGRKPDSRAVILADRFIPLDSDPDTPVLRSKLGRPDKTDGSSPIQLVRERDLTPSPGDEVGRD